MLICQNSFQNDLYYKRVFKNHGFFQDELSAPPVEDFLPSGYSTTTTETPTAPPLPSPVEAVPAGFDQNYESDEVADEVVTNAPQVEKASDFHNFEDVDQAEKVEIVRQVEPLVQVDDAAEGEKADDGHIEIHEQVVEDATEQPLDEAEPVEQVQDVRQVDQVQQVEQVQEEEQLAEDEQALPVEQASPVEKVQLVEEVQHVEPVQRLQPAPNVEDVEEFIKPAQQVKV